MTTTGPNDSVPRSQPYTSDAERRSTPDDLNDRRHGAGDRDRDGVPDDRERQRALGDRDGDGVADVRERRVADDRLRDDRLGFDPRHDRELVVARERERFGGVKVGAAFFGWLTATGAVVLLTALAAAIAALIATLTGGIDDAVEDAQQNLQSTGIWGIVILLAIWSVAYYCGGYVAGRMARFDGAKQGVAVWAWAVVIAIIAALIGLVAGQNFALPPGSMPTLPLPEDQATTATIISAVVVAIVALVGAVLGGLAGMRFHRRVDRAGFEVDATDERR
ncbi:hypothetical protein [Agrococcus beijingensis]|uniref:hypothetical protein n=1 Tax=Agrococcus beijingensis TaxID=3068634 RepID=UPI00274164D3|nr:hypothetical protein [Agrococcus sp. REN33]